MPALERGRFGRSTAEGCALVALMMLCGGAAQAASLQVAPTSLELTARQNAGEMWISNSGTTDVQVQARVFRWTQRDGRDALDPTTDLVVSPPMRALKAGEQQLIRVVRAQPTAPDAQMTYRLIVDEVPTLNRNREGMQFVLRYSVPVFVHPEGSPAPTPTLQAAVLTQPDGSLSLEVHNGGGGYAQLADLAVGTLERPQIFKPGLLGYVLSGQTMRWPLEIPPARLAGATLSAKINGASQATPLSATPPAR